MRNITRHPLTFLLGATLFAGPSVAGCSSEGGTDLTDLGNGDDSIATGGAEGEAPPTETSSGGTPGAAGGSEAVGSGSGGSVPGASGGASSGSGGVASLDSDPTCERGILNGDGSACCDAACGACGGEGCGDREGGPTACCSGPIIESGVSCESANAPCVIGMVEGSGGSPGTGGSAGTGGAPSTSVPQPPASCSNLDNDIPDGVQIHTVIDKHVTRPEFPDFSKWYTEDDNVQRFQLHQGDTNIANPNIPRPRVEAYAPGGWTRKSGFHEFSANYYFESWESPWRYAVFQIKTNDASNFIIQGLIDKNGKFIIARRSKGTVTVDENVFQKPFHLRVRSDGTKFEVFYNCEKVLAENHPQPHLENDNTRYHFRWGLYRQEQTGSDFQKGTTTMFVTGPKWN